MEHTLSQLHAAIEKLFRGPGRIPTDDADVRFDRPVPRWVDTLDRPTLNWFLFDMAESSEFRNVAPQVQRSAAGATTRLAPRRIDLRYLVCGISNKDDEEYRLTWRALAVLLRHPMLPREVWPENAAPDVAVPVRVGEYDRAPQLVDLWQALGVPPRPSLICTITAPMDLAVEEEASLVFTRLVRTTRTTPDDERAGRGFDPEAQIPRAGLDREYEPLDVIRVVAARFSIAGTVRDRQGRLVEGVIVRAEGRNVRHEYGRDGELHECRTGADGRYRIDNLTRGPITLWVHRQGAPAHPVEIEVPGRIYDMTLD